MVSLGFVSSSDRCPDHVRHVRVLPGDASSATFTPAGVEIAPDHLGRTRWLLTWYVPDRITIETWTRRMASQLHVLAWNPWCLDVESLERTMGLPADRALLLWGEPFWSVYPADSRNDIVVYLIVGEHRRLIYQAVRHWEARFTHVRFATEHDLDGASSGQQ
ncbi:hypothetical protein [Desulfonatronum sp. SC1]|uniref:hypothetical protein n=1 Tax=Desulfonatronum sp. SC1 TaxID=2109626 RepID=UPI000D2F8BF5|nr:hypothetical protein [Desulfonatronum sp. SC1]PTN36870.1 hypothetical protein C6366_08360 [Desulfonatronum sp. SC1]